MKRRALILGFGAGFFSLTVRGQTALPVVAILDTRSANALAVEQVRKGLAEAGYREGSNVVVKYQGADGRHDRLPGLAAQLVRERVNVIITMSPPPTYAAKTATSAIPIVFLIGYDPVKLGLVERMNRPGGNITGISMLGAGLVAKRLQILREVVPSASRIGLLVNPSNPDLVKSQSDEAQGAAGMLPIEIVQARSEPELHTAFAALGDAKVGAALIGPDPVFVSKAQVIVDLAAKYRIPATYEWRDFVEAGGLLSYGSSRADDYRLLGVYAGRILSGAKPSDLPVVQPTKFELVINLKTAVALGLTVPASLLARADEVIE